MNNPTIKKQFQSDEEVKNFLMSLLAGTDSETIQNIARAVKNISVKIELTPNPPMEK